MNVFFLNLRSTCNLIILLDFFIDIYVDNPGEKGRSADT